MGLLGSVRELSCDRDHHSDGGHVGYLVLGVREGGLLRLGVVGGHDGRVGGEGGVTSSSVTVPDSSYTEVFSDTPCFFLAAMMVQTDEDCFISQPVYLQPPQ